MFFLTASDMWHPYFGLTPIGQRFTGNVPRMLATILNGTIVAGMVVLLQRRRTTRLIPCRALTHFVREQYFSTDLYWFTEGFCDRGDASSARFAPAALSIALICWRRPCSTKFAVGTTFRSQTSAAVTPRIPELTMHQIGFLLRLEESAAESGTSCDHKRRPQDIRPKQFKMDRCRFRRVTE